MGLRMVSCVWEGSFGVLVLINKEEVVLFL